MVHVKKVYDFFSSFCSYISYAVVVERSRSVGLQQLLSLQFTLSSAVRATLWRMAGDVLHCFDARARPVVVVYTVAVVFTSRAHSLRSTSHFYLLLEFGCGL